MKFPYLILLSTLSGCVNLEFPGLIADTAKVSKDAYAAIVGSDEEESATPATESGEFITNAYIGQETQSISEIKQQCVNEAAEKLIQIAGKEVRYTVAENTIATVNNTVVANCKLVVDKSADDIPVAKQ